MSRAEWVGQIGLPNGLAKWAGQMGRPNGPAKWASRPNGPAKWAGQMSWPNGPAKRAGQMGRATWAGQRGHSNGPAKWAKPNGPMGRDRTGRGQLWAAYKTLVPGPCPCRGPNRVPKRHGSHIPVDPKRGRRILDDQCSFSVTNVHFGRAYDFLALLSSCGSTRDAIFSYALEQS